MKISLLKIPVAILLPISTLFWPFWLTLILFLIGCFLFERFYFGLVVLLFMDVLYGFQGFMVGPFHGILTIFGILAFILVGIIKERTFGFGR